MKRDMTFIKCTYITHTHVRVYTSERVQTAFARELENVPTHSH